MYLTLLNLYLYNLVSTQLSFLSFNKGCMRHIIPQIGILGVLHAPAYVDVTSVLEGWRGLGLMVASAWSRQVCEVCVSF